MTTKKAAEQVHIEDGLVVVPQATVPEIFESEDNILRIVKMIAEEVKVDQIDLETVKGRKEIASRAYLVSRSKTTLDNLGKDLVADLKAKTKKVDAVRKTARDELDLLRDEIRKPLDEYEAEQERIAAEDQATIEAERQRLEEEAKMLADWDMAIQMNESFDLRKKQEEQEAEIRRLREAEEARLREEQEKKEAEERKVREEQERKELEERLRKEAEERAEKEKQAAIAREREESERKLREEREKVERERLEREEKERKEREEQERREANKRHRAKINNAAARGIVKAMADAHSGNKEEAQKIAKAIVTAIAKGEVDNVTINY